MSNSKPTPGPWKVCEDNMGIATEKYGIADCYFPHSEMPIQERRANARLIAAAPELLRVCKVALELEEELPEQYQHPGFQTSLFEAIKKAEGIHV